MARYYLNRKQQSNGDHEVHASTCTYVPDLQNRIDLGEHATCQSAVRRAKEMYPQSQINGCYFCSNACHTT